MRKRERENCKSEPLSLVSRARSDMRVSRKLEDICQSLTLPAEQGRVVEFLANTKNAQKMNGLVEDVYEVFMGYWVCMSNCPFSAMSDLCTRLHCNKILTMRVASLL